MANIPGASDVLPGVIVDVQTQSRGASVPGGTRIAAIIGEGLRSETIVSSALGNGLDGLNSSYSSATGADGRHFVLSLAPVIEGRTKLYKNGILLTGKEVTSISGASFSYRYDYIVDPTTGRIELQKAKILDQGGDGYVTTSTNTGVGGILGLTLLDSTAPTETWIVKCVSVQRNSGGTRMSSTAKFVGFGSVSGQKLDGYGNPIYWTANGATVDNTILQFAITETSTFKEGDSFTILVQSGMLSKNDTLTASYIYQLDLNDPTFYDSMLDITNKHGLVSTDNTLSLGSQLAFANGAPGVMTVQAAPSVPRRTSIDLATKWNASSIVTDDFILPLPLDVIPDPNSNIHFFVTDPTTLVETQILPNKYGYYTVGTGGSYPTKSAFITSNTTYNYYYSLIADVLVIDFATDGYLTNIDGYNANFSSTSITFDSTYVTSGYSIKIIDATNVGNVGTWLISDVTAGVAKLTRVSGTFVTEATPIKFESVDTTQTTGTKYIILNNNVVPNGNSLRVSIVTDKDATFYDAGWAAALTSLEVADANIIVPLPKQTISAIFQNTLTHCKTMSSKENKKERMLFTGAISGLTPDNVIGTKLAAVEDIGVLEGIQGDSAAEILAGTTEDQANYSVSNAYGNTFRCVYFYPDQIVANVAGQNTTLDGFYIAAAAAGYLSGIGNVAIPLTNKTLSGFSITKTKQFSPTVQKKLVKAGICLVTPISGGGNVAWGKTTTQSGYPEEEEISIVFIRDTVASTLRAGFQGFIGNPEDDTTDLAMSARAIALLISLKSQKLITQYTGLTVKQDPVDPRQWDIGVLVQPTYSINWVYISVGIGLI